MKALILRALKEAAVVGDSPPEWFQVFPYGEILIEGEKPAIMDEGGAALVIDHFNSLKHDMVIDYEHQTLTGEKAPAAGWVKEFQWRGADGLWARVEWTEEAKSYIEKREYRYFSPVFLCRKKDRKIVEIYNLALTNQPLMMNIRALAAKYDIVNPKEGGDIMLEKLKKLLGLADDAGEDAVFVAAKAVVDKNKELETKGEVVACKEVLEALKLEGNPDREKVVASISALQAPATAARELSQEVANLKTRIAGMEQEDLVGLALKEGKTSPDELDKWGRDLALKNPEQFKLIVLSRPAGSVVPLEKVPGGPKDNGPGHVDDATLQVAKMMGNTEDDLKKYAQA